MQNGLQVEEMASVPSDATQAQINGGRIAPAPASEIVKPPVNLRGTGIFSRDHFTPPRA
jgi:hypothetical protein